MYYGHASRVKTNIIMNRQLLYNDTAKSLLTGSNNDINEYRGS